MRYFSVIINAMLLVNDAYIHYVLFKLSDKKIYLLTLVVISAYIATLLISCANGSIPSLGFVTTCITLGTLTNYISAAFTIANRKQLK